jgi:hypothetical protein
LRRVIDIEPEPEQVAANRPAREDMHMSDGIVKRFCLPSLFSWVVAVADADADVLHAVENSILARWNHVVDTGGSDIEDEENGDHSSFQQDDEDSTFDWDKFDVGAGLSAWDNLGEGYERDAARIGKLPHQSHYEFEMCMC